MHTDMAREVSEPSLSFEEAFRKLKSRRIGERVEAETALQAMGAEAVEGLMAIVSREQAKRNVRRRIYLSLVVLFCLTAIPASILLILHAISTGEYGELGALGAILGGGGGGILGGFAWLLNQSSDQIVANNMIARLEDKRTVGPLLLALQSSMDPFARTSAAAALLRIAYKLHEEDETHVDAEQRACLTRAIRGADPRREFDYLAALLVLASKVGDADTLAAIEPLTSRAPSNDREASVLQMARESADQLRSRLARSRDSATLLRPTADAASDSLLRPMAAAPASDPQQLLRAATAESPPA